MQLAPGNARDPPSRGLEGAIARSVALEGLAGSVGLEAVELDDQPGFGPGEVDLDALYDGVDIRAGETGVIEEGR